MSKIQTFFIFGFLSLTLFFVACEETDEEEISLDPIDTIEEDSDSAENLPMAFLYQYVGPFENGGGKNGVSLGLCSDGVTISSYDTEDALQWSVSPAASTGYGDPVFSRLSNGDWSMTAWSHQNDARGSGKLLYYEGSCPLVDDEQVIAIGTSSAKGCTNVPKINGSKTSQVFAAEDGNYVFHMIQGEIYLAQLSDADSNAMDLDALCVLESEADSLADLGYGDSTLVLSDDDLLLSDTAIGQRADGTWVLFVKGIEKDSGCVPLTMCELCSRSIYRSTSTDLINWGPLEKVVESASVPEATNTVDGTVWLYWQDFSNTCEADDQNLANIAPISGAYEEAGSYELSDPMTVSFPDEAFEGNSGMHYATNGNPVMLPDEEAVADYEACME